MRIRHQKDFAAGLLYLALGLGFAGLSTGFRFGTTARMGPGYFPFWCGVLLAVLGAVIFLRSLSPNAEPDRLTRWDLRGLGTVLLSVVLFGLTLQSLGVLIAVALAVVLSSFAAPGGRWLRTLVTAVALALLCAAIFAWGLGLQIPVWPRLGG
jgi:hypothetical protein